jgi:zinc-ribbon domain
MPPSYCPHCGAAVPPRARVCPACGSDESTGWSDEAALDRLGAPSQEFDYEEFVKEEFPSPRRHVRPHGISWFWWLTALIVLLSLIYFLFL